MEALKLTLQLPKMRNSIRQSCVTLLVGLSCSPAFPQNGDANALGLPSPPGTAGASDNSASKNTAQSTGSQSTASKPWIVRDPYTGRVFQQQLVPVSVPVTRWEARTVDQTVYEPRVATQLQQVPQTTYVPNTQYVMQPKVTGWWNPFKQPVQAYQYVPVTSWIPHTQQVANPIITQQFFPKQQKIVVYQPVQGTEIRQQLVQTELPQPKIATNSIASVSAPRQPLFRLPILAQQRVLPLPTPQTTWLPAGQPVSQSALANARPYSPPAYASSIGHPQYATTGLRAVASPQSSLVLPPLSLPRFAASPYSAPLQTTTSVGTTASRDTLQSGMQPTVLR